MKLLDIHLKLFLSHKSTEISAELYNMIAQRRRTFCWVGSGLYFEKRIPATSAPAKHVVIGRENNEKNHGSLPVYTTGGAPDGQKWRTKTKIKRFGCFWAAISRV